MIPIHLSSFKAAGIYRVVFDKSTILNGDVEIMRLVVGYSEKGPFNTPTYISSVSDFKTIYGDISKKLEKRGIYFHRTALQCLTEGPILCLNLKKFDGETVDASSIDIAFNNDLSEIGTVKLKVEDIYDTNRFWTLDATKLSEIRSVNEEGEYSKPLEGYIAISATNTDKSSRSYFIRKASGQKVAGFNISVSDWYKDSSEEVPEYLQNHLNNMVSDFFAEIYVFDGRFTADQVGASETLKNYFNPATMCLKPYVLNAFGDATDTLDALYNDPTSGAISHYVGALIPNFKDKQGVYQSLDIKFNTDVDINNLMMNFNTDLLEEGEVNIDLSGRMNITEEMLASIKNHEGKSNLLGNFNAPILADVFDDDMNVDDDSLIANENEVFGTSVSFLPCGIEPEEKDGNFIISGEVGSLPDMLSVGDCILAADGTTDTDGDGEADEKDTFYDNVYVQEISSKKFTKVKVIENGDLTDWANKEVWIESTAVAGGSYYIYESKENAEDGIPMDNIIVKITKKLANNIYEFMSSDFDGNVYAQAGKVEVLFGEDAEAKFSYIAFSGMPLIYNNYLVRIDAPLNQEIGTMKPVFLSGYTYKNSKPASTSMLDKLNWQNFILSALTDYKGIRTGLLNKSEIDYRYIIDSFESYVTTSCKAVLSFLAKEKQSAFAILNFPSVKTFMKCPYASFTDNKGVFNVDYVVKGCNPKKAHSLGFGIPSESEGASFCAFYTPLKFSDGYVDNILPSAGLVSNLFMEKYMSRQPYYIIAGPNYGAISASGLIGPDYNYSMDELQIIEPYGVNCMVYRPNFGTFINANQTAKQTPRSALSAVNVRELVIYLQDEIERLLQSYQWEFNNQVVRNKIKDRADAICTRIQQNGGIIDFINIMDESNNTPEIIDNEMAVLSTHIEPGRGMGKMVHELTIYRTGQMRSSIME